MAVEHLGDPGSLFLLVANGNFSDYNNSANISDSARFRMPTYLVAWVTIVNIVVFLIGILGNLLVVMVVLCVKEMKTSTNLCLMNLSVADLLVLVICQSSALIEFFCHEKWLLGEAMCKLVVFLENMVTVASILIILTVSLERFWAVYYPLKTYSRGSKFKAMISMSVVWTIAAVTALPLLVMAHTDQQYHHVDEEVVFVCGTHVTDAWHKAYILSRFVLVFVVPLCLLSVLYTLIIAKVRQETLQCKQMTEAAKSLSHQSRKQLVAMLVGIIILFFICLLPFRMMALWVTFFPNHGVIQVGAESYLNIIYFCRLLVYLNSAGNPIIYNLMSTKFRRAFQKVLRLYCCCCKKRLAMSRHALNGTSSSHGARMTTLSHYSVIRQEHHYVCQTAHAV